MHESPREGGCLVSWYFESSQPQRITSGLKQTSICLLFTLQTNHQTKNHPETTKTVTTQIYIKQNIYRKRKKPCSSLAKKREDGVFVLCENCINGKTVLEMKITEKRRKTASYKYAIAGKWA